MCYLNYQSTTRLAHSRSNLNIRSQILVHVLYTVRDKAVLCFKIFSGNPCCGIQKFNLSWWITTYYTVSAPLLPLKSSFSFNNQKKHILDPNIVVIQKCSSLFNFESVSTNCSLGNGCKDNSVIGGFVLLLNMWTTFYKTEKIGVPVEDKVIKDGSCISTKFILLFLWLDYWLSIYQKENQQQTKFIL